MKTKLTPKSISQPKLARLYELKQLVDEYNELKGEVVNLLKQGLPCAPGRYMASLKVESFTSIPWKDEYIKVAGEDEAENVARRYKGNSERNKFSIVDRDNPVS